MHFDQYASDFDEHSVKTIDNWQKSDKVFGVVHFDQCDSNFDDFSWKHLTTDRILKNFFSLLKGGAFFDEM